MKSIESFKSHFNRRIVEKANNKNKSKINKLIKELEILNAKGKEDVSDLIATLKRERDLKENKTFDDIVLVIKEDYSYLCKILDI